ncbi:MAG: sensor signal transduction histidine kinase [Myxococcaceae bacterium]|nr:sensor signal transduction histidine kinase [Myxococcaceae bacterium]
MNVTSHLNLRAQDGCAVPAVVELQARAAEQLPMATAITCGRTHVIHFANSAFASFCRCARDQLVGRAMESVWPEPERIAALLARACQTGTAELATELAYVTDDGSLHYSNMLAQPLVRGAEPNMMIQVVDTTTLTQRRNAASQEAVELKLANERLLLASLREQQLAERAAAATREVERLLQRKSVLSEVNALLSSSLELGDTLRIVARLALPDLADFCVVQVAGQTDDEPLALAHRDEDQAGRMSTLHDALLLDGELAALSSQVVQGEEPVFLAGPFLTTDRGVQGIPALLRDAGARSGLALPLRFRGRTLGVLALFSSTRGQAYDDRDVDFAIELAQRASIAIDNAQLYREAKCAVRLHEDVLAVVSHDLRTPLSTIALTVQRLIKRSGQHAPELERSYEVVLRSTKHMRRLIEELLEAAIVQTGELVLQREKTSLTRLIREAVDMFEPVAQQKGIQLIAPTQLLDDAVTCDPDRIVRVLANLIGNAVKFTPADGTVEVTASLDPQEACVRVRDTGPGVALSERDRLFEQYWKGVRTGRAGIGLGLYIASEIVKAHEGRIWVESDPPLGSTFGFSIPLGGAAA